MPRVRVAAVILNYRTPGLVMDCLASLEGQIDAATDEAVVVDNASGDGSAETIENGIAERGFGSWARVVRSSGNDGFSAGNNVGMRASDAEFYLLLNSDTIVRPGAVAELRDAATAHPDAGLIGPRLEWSDGRAQISCFRGHSVASQLIAGAQTGFVTKLFGGFDVAKGVFDVPTEADWVSFACVMIPRGTIERVGYMDEGFFMYFEDAEFGRRARRKGMRVLYWPAARVVHLRGGTSPVKSAASERKRVPIYFYRARARYFALSGGRPHLLLANLAWMLGWSIAVARWIIQRRPIGTARHASRDIWSGFGSPLVSFRPGENRA